MTNNQTVSLASAAARLRNQHTAIPIRNHELADLLTIDRNARQGNGNDNEPLTAELAHNLIARAQQHHQLAALTIHIDDNWADYTSDTEYFATPPKATEVTRANINALLLAHDQDAHTADRADQLWDFILANQ